MKKMIAVILLVALLAVSTAALANVKFTGSCYVYKKAGSGKTKTVIHKGSILKDLSNGKYWTKVDLGDGTTGWVRTKYVTSTPKKVVGPIYGAGGQGKSKEVGSETTGVKGSKIKATGRVHVRSKASLDSTVLGTLKVGQTLPFKGATKTDSRGVKFYKVSYDGSTAWVSAGYADLIK